MEYVCTGATLKCTMGTSCPKLKATPKNVSLTGKDQANIADYVSIKNVPSFGRCRSLGYPPTASATAANHGKLTPMPCVPGTCPKWKAIDKDSLICGEPALLKPATLKCMYGGTISIVDPGQTLEIKVQGVSKQSENKKKEKAEQEIPEELLQEFNELDTEGLNKDSVLDGVQLALDAAGMVPVLGAIPDLINASISVLRGDWVGAGLSIVAAVPGVGDVVGGAKIAYKGAKIAGKVSAKSAKAGKAVAKGPSNVFPIDSAKSANRTVNPSDIKSDNVVRQNFDDLSKQRVTNTSIERQVEVKKNTNVKSASSNNVHYMNDEVAKQRAVKVKREQQIKTRKVANGKYHVSVETETAITNSVGGVGRGNNNVVKIGQGKSSMYSGGNGKPGNNGDGGNQGISRKQKKEKSLQEKLADFDNKEINKNSRSSYTNGFDNIYPNNKSGEKFDTNG